MNSIFTRARTRHLEGLIIDLQINGGGSDALGIHIAPRLTRRTSPLPNAPAPRYTGPIAVLTGGSTVSAGETFTQALIDRPDGVLDNKA